MGAEQGRAHHQHELRGAVRSDAGARAEEGVGERRDPDRGGRQCRAEVAAALSGGRSARHRRDGDRRERQALQGRRTSARRSRSRRPASTSWFRRRPAPISSPPAPRSRPRMSAASRRCCSNAIRRPTRRLILEVLTASATRLGANKRDDKVGWGLIDPLAALSELDARLADTKVASTTAAAPAPAAGRRTPARAPTTTAPAPAAATTRSTLPRPGHLCAEAIAPTETVEFDAHGCCARALG